MADINEILGRNINSIKELKQAINELQNSLIGVDAESEEFKKTSQQLAAAQAELNKVTSAGKTETDAAADSIRGLEKQYKALYDQYKLLSEEQRNSDFGKNMAQSMSDLSNKINEAKQNVGNFKDNIGRYAESATKAFQGMGISLGNLQKPLAMATTGTKTLGVALKGLAANPVGAAIMAVVVVLKALHEIFQRVKQAIADNEELTMRLHEAMATFQPILDAISNAFDFLARILVRVIEGMAKVSGAIMSLIPGMKKAIDSHKELAKATNNLTKAQRELSVENSKKEAEIERLREEASATDDVKEKVRLLQEAKKKQREVDEENIRIAKEDLRIKEEYAKKTANSAEANDELAAAQKRVNDAIAQGDKNARQYNKQLSALSQNIDIDVNITITEEIKKAEEELEVLHQGVRDIAAEKRRLKEEIEELTVVAQNGPVKDTFWENVKSLTTARTDELFEQLHAQRELSKKWKELEELNNSLYDTIDSGVTKQDEIERLRAKQAEEARKHAQEEYKKQVEEAKNLLKQLSGYGQDEITLLTTKYREEYDLLKRFGFDTATLTQKYLDDVAKITEERYKKQREETIKYLEQQYTDREAFIEGIAETNERLANSLRLDDLEKKTIPVLQSFYNKVSGMSKEALDIISKKGFQGLDDEYKDLKEGIENINAALGTNITNFEILGVTLTNTKNAAKELMGVIAQQGVDEVIKRANEGFLNLNLQSILGDSANEYAIMVAKNTWDALQVEREALEQELVNFKGTHDQKIEMLERYYEVVQEIRDKELELTTLQQERTAQMIESLIDMTDKMAAAMQTYRSSQESLIDSEVKAGKISEKEAEKRKKSLLKLQAAETAFSIATITADAAAGIFNIWKGYAMEKGVINPQTAAAAGIGAGPALWALNAKSLVSAIAQTASLASTAAAQIAAARGQYVTAQNNFQADAGGGSVGLAATPMLIDSTPVTYTQTVQNVDEEDELNKRPIIVRVEDIIDGIDGHNVRVSESSF